LAAGRQIDWRLLLATLSGTALVIGAGCVLNNIADRRIDSLMQRTSRRALVKGSISASQAMAYALLLSGAGFAILMTYTNTLTVYAGLAGLYFYVVVYGMAKRQSPAGTLLGSIAGSMPVVAGYVAAKGQLDITAGLLFMVMAYWQMPHFYAIALYRLDDYKAAGLPVLPAVGGIARTKRRILGYIGLYAAGILALRLFGGVGVSFTIINLLICVVWIWYGVRHYRLPHGRWAKVMFRISLLAMLGLSASLAVNPWLI
jgi:protoheme IX farnesyltransferase